MGRFGLRGLPSPVLPTLAQLAGPSPNPLPEGEGFCSWLVVAVDAFHAFVTLLGFDG